jgi:riboflavin synthase
MFTGIIERTGKVVSLVTRDVDGTRPITQIIIDPGQDFATKIGDSVAINGCCLTVTSNKMNWLSFDVSSETLAKTTLGGLIEGSDVNLERAMQLSDRLGGHLVSGHVDGLAVVDRVNKQPDGWYVSVHLTPELGRWFVNKGSVCLDGVSLTVNEVHDLGEATQLSLMLIPTTVSLTTFKDLKPGQKLNLEIDLIAKYVDRLRHK